MRFDNQKVSEKMDKIITAERPSMMHKEGGGVPVIDRSGILTASSESEASANLNCQIRSFGLSFGAEA